MRILIKNGTVLCPVQNINDKKDLIIEDGVIKEITKANSATGSFDKTIDATNLTVIPGLVDMHTHLRGACPHQCGYCYVQHGTAARTGHYAGELRLEEKEFTVKYGKGKKIFIEHCSDLFADEVPDAWIERIVEHAEQWPENDYIVQTKNPARMMKNSYVRPWKYNFVLGATIESNLKWDAMGNAPHPGCRFVEDLDFVTIEPIMIFSDSFDRELIRIKPRFINIGADSKRCNLPEPKPDDIRSLIADLRAAGIEVRLKPNLSRLLPEVTA